MFEIQNNYNEYLNSFAWKAIKQVKLEQAPNCEVCWLKANSVHHLSYERLWKEQVNDIVSICYDCHRQCHYINWFQIKNSEKVLRARFKELTHNVNYVNNWAIQKDSHKEEQFNIKNSPYYLIEDTIYYDDTIVWTDADINTFEKIDDIFGKDYKNIYVCGNKLKWANPLKFREIKYPYYQDNDNIYYDYGYKLSE